MVDRYDIFSEPGTGETSMEVEPGGEYVKHADHLALAKLVMDWRDAAGQWMIASAKESPGDLDSAAEQVQSARAAMIAAAKEVLDA